MIMWGYVGKLNRNKWMEAWLGSFLPHDTNNETTVGN